MSYLFHVFLRLLGVEDGPLSSLLRSDEGSVPAKELSSGRIRWGGVSGSSSLSELPAGRGSPYAACSEWRSPAEPPAGVGGASSLRALGAAWQLITCMGVSEGSSESPAGEGAYCAACSAVAPPAPSVSPLVPRASCWPPESEGPSPTAGGGGGGGVTYVQG